jgi:tetratricopeptide (TPR) repeat protein
MAKRSQQQSGSNLSRPSRTTFLQRICWTFLIIGAIFTVLVAIYSPALHGSYLWDDDANVTKPELRSWDGLVAIWTRWGATQTYYPLLHSVFWIEHHLWGDNTLGYHLANIFWHAISVYLVYLILRRLQIPGASLAAAIFALHPVMVESVAWITEQKNTLSGVLYFGSLLAYLHFDVDRRRTTYALAMSLFVLSLWTKTITVTLPAAILVILWWQRGKIRWRQDVVPLLPWFALSLLMGIFTAWYEQVYVGVQFTGLHLTLPQKILLSCRAVWFYFGKLIFPTQLTLIYPRWNIDTHQTWQYLYVVAFLLVLGGAWSVRHRWRAPLASLLYFVGTLSPLLGFFGTFIFLYTFVCDHFQYLASLGIIVPVAAAIALFAERHAGTARNLTVGACALMLGALAFGSWQQSRFYTDSMTLYQTMIARNPECWMAYNNLGITLEEQNQPEKALQSYRKAIELKPDYAEAHNNLGMYYYNSHRLTEAIQEYEEALRLQPNYLAAEINLGNTSIDQNQSENAIKHYEAALAINPKCALAFYDLGNTYLKLGRTEQAIEHYRKAEQAKMETAELHYNLGIALAQSGKAKEAIEELNSALKFNPSSSQIHNNLGAALLDSGHPDEAISHFQQALRLGTEDLAVYKNLTDAYLRMNRRSEAIATAQRALQLARLQGETQLAQQIEAWLSKQDSQPAAGQTPPPTPSPLAPSS